MTTTEDQSRRKDDTRAATTLKWPEACSICAGTGTAFGKTCVCRVGSQVHPESALPSMRTESAAAPELAALPESVRIAGAKMANTMFNLSQDANMIPLLPLRESMRAMQREWDAAIHSAVAEPAQAATDAVRESWPAEPTPEMQQAGASAIRFDTTVLNKLWTTNAVYRAMREVALRIISTEGAAS